MANRFSDIDLDFTKNPVSGDVNILKDDVAVKRSVRNLVLTSRWERLMQPEIDSKVSDRLFENITPITASLIQSNIEDLINRYEPRAKLVDVQVYAFPDQNAFECSIIYRIGNQPQEFTLTTALERLR